MDVGSRLWKVLDVRPAAEERAGVGYTAGGLYHMLLNREFVRPIGPDGGQKPACLRSARD